MDKTNMTREEAIRLLKERNLIVDDCAEEISKGVVKAYDECHSQLLTAYDKFNDLMEIAIFTDEKVSEEAMADAFAEGTEIAQRFTDELITLATVAEVLGVEPPEYEEHDDSDFVRMMCEQKMS